MGTFLNHPWLYMATAAFAAVILWYVYRQPHRPGARQFSWLISVYLVWALAAALATVTHSNRTLYVLFVLQSVCPLLVTALELMVVLEYTGNEKWIARRTLLLLYFPALLLIVIAFTLPEFMVSLKYRSGIVIFAGQPVVRWAGYAYASIIFLISCSILFTRLMRAPAFWAPILLLIVGAILPVAGYAIMRPEWITVSPIQATSLMNNITMLTYFVALFNFRILQVIPVARDMLIARVPYGLLALDSGDHLVDFNPATETLPGLPGKLVMQRAASQALGDWWDRLAPLISREPLSQDIVVQTKLGVRIFHVISLPLLQPSGWRLGQVFILQDITEMRRAQEQHEQTQQSLVALQERERLARELHDSLGQTLAATHLQASTARILLAQGDAAQTDECLEQVAQMTIAAEADIREYLLAGKTGFWRDHRFFPALQQYVLRFRQQYRLPVELIIPPQLEAQGLGLSIEVQLMRIIQEALSNIRKHACAKSVQVIFTDSEPLVQVTIIDDGEGFDLADVARRTEGFGLQVMRERTEALGGFFEVTSQPGQGTQVVVKVPIQMQAEEGREVV